MMNTQLKTVFGLYNGKILSSLFSSIINDEKAPSTISSIITKHIDILYKNEHTPTVETKIIQKTPTQTPAPIQPTIQPTPVEIKTTPVSSAESSPTSIKGKSPYAIFSANRRKSIKKEQPNKTKKEITKLVKQEWKDMSKEEKQKYIKQFPATPKKTRKPNLWLFYRSQSKEELKKKYPNKSMPELTKIQSELYKKMTVEQKTTLRNKMMNSMEKKVTFEQKVNVIPIPENKEIKITPPVVNGDSQNFIDNAQMITEESTKINLYDPQLSSEVINKIYYRFKQMKGIFYRGPDGNPDSLERRRQRILSTVQFDYNTFIKDKEGASTYLKTRGFKSNTKLTPLILNQCKLVLNEFNVTY